MLLRKELHLFLLFLLLVACMPGQAQTTVSDSSFTDVKGNLDENISYAAAIGTASTSPQVINGIIRVYQKGGTFSISAKNGVTITAVTIGSTQATLVTYTVDGQTASKDFPIKEGGRLNLPNLTVKDNILFTCTGAVKTSRLNINYLSVTYELPVRTSIVLDENASTNKFTSGSADVILRRTFNADAWNTLVLPFSMTPEQVTATFGAQTEIANYTGATKKADGTYTLDFKSSVSGIAAGIPVFIHGASGTGVYEIKGVTLVAGSPAMDAKGFSFAGTYDETKAQRGDWFISSDNNFYQATGTETIKPFRALFRPSAAAKARVLRLAITGSDGTVTSISSLTGKSLPDAKAPSYNMAGQRVGKTYKGILVQKGRKFINH